jgi:hypothetical protein
VLYRRFIFYARNINFPLQAAALIFTGFRLYIIRKGVSVKKINADATDEFLIRAEGFVSFCMDGLVKSQFTSNLNAINFRLCASVRVHFEYNSRLLTWT